MEINIKEIEKSAKNIKLEHETRKIIEIFLAAINDWPNPVLTIEAYEKDLKNFIQGQTTQNNLFKSLKQIDFNKNSWEAESISQIIEVFKFYPKDFSLQEIVMNLREEIKLLQSSN